MLTFKRVIGQRFIYENIDFFARGKLFAEFIDISRPCSNADSISRLSLPIVPGHPVQFFVSFSNRSETRVPNCNRSVDSIIVVWPSKHWPCEFDNGLSLTCPSARTIISYLCYIWERKTNEFSSPRYYIRNTIERATFNDDYYYRYKYDRFTVITCNALYYY